MGYTASDETTEVTSKPKPYHQEHDDDTGGQLARQSSIYSLTLDEIQNAVCEPGKHFGSMNMDEFLANIWTAEEEAHASTAPHLHRQGSLTLPAPLSGKTVDEVWAQIHHDQHQQHQPFRHHQSQPAVSTATRNANHRQHTFGEMTLEDFLVKAGVVREAPTPQQPPTPAAAQQYGVPGYQVSPNGPGFDHMVGASYEDLSSTLCYTANGNGSGDVGGEYNAAMPFSRRMSNGYGTAATSSPSEDGVEGGQLDDTVGFGAGGRGAEGRNYRKRAADGSVEKVVERRQRRMIKNRESAARSRARKQAYTVELEAELNQLREENDRLRKEQLRIAAMRKQLILDAMTERAHANTRKANRILSRCRSCSW